MTLNKLIGLRNLIIGCKGAFLRRFWGMDIHPTVQFSLSVRFDRTNPKGIHIGEESYLAFESAILSHDALNNRHVDTWIGKRCFIGARVLVMPGVRIGDHSVIAAGSVVTKDIPPHSLAAGNPAQVIRTGVSISETHVFTEKGVPVIAGRR